MRSYPYAGARQRTARPRWRLHWRFAEDDRTLWQVDLPVPLAPDAVNEGRAADRARASAPPTHRGVFDTYLTADKGAVAQDPGAAAVTQSRCILHAIPARTRELPPDRRRGGCVNLDFQCDGQGAHCEGRCLAQAPLPDYPVTRLRVGPFRAGEKPLGLAELPARPAPVGRPRAVCRRSHTVSLPGASARLIRLPVCRHSDLTCGPL